MSSFVFFFLLKSLFQLQSYYSVITIFNKKSLASELHLFLTCKVPQGNKQQKISPQKEQSAKKER